MAGRPLRRMRRNGLFDSYLPFDPTKRYVRIMGVLSYQYPAYFIEVRQTAYTCQGSRLREAILEDAEDRLLIPLAIREYGSNFGAQSQDANMDAHEVAESLGTMQYTSTSPGDIVVRAAFLSRLGQNPTAMCLLAYLGDLGIRVEDL